MSDFKERGKDTAIGILMTSEKTVEALGDAIVKIFNSANENRMDQETVRTALMILECSGNITGTTISHCNVDMGK